MDELPPGFELTQVDGKWELLSLGPGGITTTTYDTKANAEAAIKAIVAAREAA